MGCFNACKRVLAYLDRQVPRASVTVPLLSHNSIHSPSPSIHPYNRCEVVERRARFESKRALSRLHQVQGFLLAMKRMTDVIKVRFHTFEEGSTLQI